MNLLLSGPRTMRRFCLFLAVVAACSLALFDREPAHAQEVRFRPGDHIAYIGNTTADRMQHHAWLETYLHSRFPTHKLTFRNLGFSGDELKLRQRADNFGNPDQWLSKCQADTVFCFFGYNEALRGGEAGLAAFRRDLVEVIGHMRSQKYDGKSAPQLVFFSPIRHEDLQSPHLPDGSANNPVLEKYAAAIGEVCRETQTPFVDLFAITGELYQKHAQPLTMNGIHLLDEGNRLVAQAVLPKLVPGAQPPSDAAVRKLREAVLDKNLHWFSRYRVVDEYNVFGGRSKLAWFGQSNADVMMREMEIFDVKTANRDRRVWALAQGRDLLVQDNNLPGELVVRPNREGPLEGGKFPYIEAESAIDRMTVHEGFEVNLFASEEQFPRLVNPVQMAVDPDSRLWASVWPSYPHWNPTQPRRDALVILPDEDQDGKADELIVFADELNSITGFEFWGGGVLVAAPPEIWFLKDTDGDDKADVKLRVLQGVSSADTHHSANAMVIGPDGWLYWSRGIFNVAAFETPTKTYRSGKSGVHRFNPRTYEVEFHYPIGPNPHGDVFDRWGYQFANDGTSGTGGYIGIGKGLRPGNKQWFKKEWRPVAATGILSSSHFPPENQNNFLICNTIGFLGILQYKVQYDGANITAVRTQDLLRSSDENFRPVDIEIGGDGALYVADWHNVLIGHMQHNMRDPNRDHEHGRIYRISAKGRDSLPPAKMKGKPIEKVLEHFFAWENSVRYRARLELSGRDSEQVVRSVERFASQLDPSQAGPDRDQAQALLECLWVLEEHRVPRVDLVKKTFAAAEPRVRAAAIRTLGHWAGRVADWQGVLMAAAKDDSALVRAEAAKAAVEFQDPVATEVIFEVANRETDKELDDVIAYARSRVDVDAMIADAVQKRRPLSPAAKAYALTRADAGLLLKMERSPEVYAALLSRAGVAARYRQQALEAVAEKEGVSPVAALVQWLRKSEREKLPSLNDLADMLAAMDESLLASESGRLAELAQETSSSRARIAAYAAWMQGGDYREAFQDGLESRAKLADALAAVNQVTKPEARDALVAMVRPLMFELPEGLRAEQQSTASQQGAVAYEYFQPNPAKNVALDMLRRNRPKLTGAHSNFGPFVPGGAKDAFATIQTAGVKIPVDGEYRFFVASDDGSRLYIDGQLLINNDGLHGMVERGGDIVLDAGLHEIVVTYFDNGGGDGLRVSWQGPGMKKQRLTANFLRPAAGANLRVKALRVVSASAAQEAEKVADFARLVQSKQLVGEALSALARLPGKRVADRIERDQLRAVWDALIAEADKATPAERQGDEFSRLLSLGESLVALRREGDADADADRRRLSKLRASIPVKADPKVMALGKEVYSRESHCATCHQPHGQGLPNLYPPLDGSLWATGSDDRLIRMVLDGMHGVIDVKGKRYSSPPLPPMTGFRRLLNDKEIAAVVTYVRNSWSNRAKPVAPRKVASVRAIDRGDASFWQANDLLALYPLEDGRKPIESGFGDGWVPKFVKAWSLNDFPVEDLDLNGRSFENGAKFFGRVGCAQCHKLGNKGGVFGPDLAKLDPKKRTPPYVLQSILDPSKDVDPKYAMHTYMLDSGKIVSGIVLKESASKIELISDPLNQDKPTVIEKDSIEDQTKTSRSIMPQGLLNWLERDDVLDLMAYVLAGGDPSHPSYGK